MSSPRPTAIARSRDWQLDLLLLLLLGGLALPLGVGAYRQMTQPRDFWSLTQDGSGGWIRQPPTAGPLLLLAPPLQPVPTTPAAARALAEVRARQLGYVIGPVAPGDLREPPLLVLLRDGGALLLLDRKGGTIRVWDPRRGEGVTELARLEPELTGHVARLTATDERSAVSPRPEERRP